MLRFRNISSYYYLQEENNTKIILRDGETAVFDCKVYMLKDKTVIKLICIYKINTYFRFLTFTTNVGLVVKKNRIRS